MINKNKRRREPEGRERLTANFRDLVANNTVSANRLVEIARDINHLDAPSFPEIGRTRDGDRNAARNLRKSFLKRSMWPPIYWAQVRCKDVKSGKIELEWMAFWLPHEIVAKLIKVGILEKILETDGMDPLAKAHLDACELEAQSKLLGLGLWADGVPCNWDRTESVQVLSLSLPGLTGEFEQLRIPITALSHKHVCEETWVDIMAVVKWSLQVLASGHNPTNRHDSTDWLPSDGSRSKASYASGAVQRSCLVEIRGDWDWMSKVYGFPQHNVLAGMCWKCTCKPKEVISGLLSK